MAIGKIAAENEQQIKEASSEEIVKQANNLLPNLVSMAGKSTPDIVKSIATAGAVGGGITGGLYWLLNRHSQEDEDEAEVVKAKIDYYNKISDEIKRQLGTKKLAPSQIAAQVQEIAARENLF
jgi:glycerate kinase